MSAQAMGFNGARLHQKVFEPSYFAHADELGFLVSWIHRHTKLLCQLLCPTWVLLVFFGREEYHLASRTTKFQNFATQATKVFCEYPDWNGGLSNRWETSDAYQTYVQDESALCLH